MEWNRRSCGTCRALVALSIFAIIATALFAFSPTASSNDAADSRYAEVSQAADEFEDKVYEALWNDWITPLQGISGNALPADSQEIWSRLGLRALAEDERVYCMSPLMLISFEYPQSGFPARLTEQGVYSVDCVKLAEDVPMFTSDIPRKDIASEVMVALRMANDQLETPTADIKLLLQFNIVDADDKVRGIWICECEWKYKLSASGMLSLAARSIETRSLPF